MLRGFLWTFLLVILFNQNVTASDDLRILEEKLTYQFLGTEFDVHSLNIIRKVKYQVLTEKGAKELEVFTLPEPIDPLYKEHAADSRGVDFYLSIDKIKNVGIKILRDGSYIKPKPKKETNRKKTVKSGDVKYTEPFFYNYKLPPLEKGDEVHINYEIKVPARAWKAAADLGESPDMIVFGKSPNSNEEVLGSFRLFFHGKYPKDRMDLRIESPPNGPITFKYMNGAEPHTSYERESVVNKWTFEKLPGCLDEVGAFPAQELPHLQIRMHQVTKDYPEMFRQRNFATTRLALKVGSTDPSYRALNSHIDRWINAYPKLGRIQMLKAIHDDITTGFTYSGDEDYFKEEVFKRLGETDGLEERVLHEFNKYDLYAALIERLELDFVCGFMMDKRHGEVSEFYIQPKYRSDYSFILLEENRTSFIIHPKSRNCGLFADELPFYYEDVPVLAIRNSYEETDQYHKQMHAGARNTMVIRTPASLEVDNLRVTTAEIDLSDAATPMSFEIELKGQFSTLQRPLYLCDEKLPSIKASYHDKWWSDLTPENLDFQTEVEETTFPFTTTVSGQASLMDISEINLTDYVQHHLDEVDSIRVMAYHPDFLFQDKVELVFTLGEKTVLELPESRSFDNEFGSFRFNCVVNEGKLLVSSNLVVRKAEVSVERIEKVNALHAEVSEALSQLIEFQ